MKTRILALNSGERAIVDASDYSLVSNIKWYAQRRTNTTYALPAGGGPPMHRLVLGLKFGDNKVVDHINGNGLDNRRSNLRVTDFLGNSLNRRKKRFCTSKYKGVTFNAKTQTWRAQIRGPYKKTLSLGLFYTEKEAAEAYDLAATELHGVFGRLNFAPTPSRSAVWRHYQSRKPELPQCTPTPKGHTPNGATGHDSQSTA